MTRGSIREYTEAVRERYLHGSKKEKGRILDEFTNITGHHRKAAVRLLRCRNQPMANRNRGRPRQCGTAVAGAQAVMPISTGASNSAKETW